MLLGVMIMLMAVGGSGVVGSVVGGLVGVVGGWVSGARGVV